MGESTTRCRWRQRNRLACNPWDIDDLYELAALYCTAAELVAEHNKGLPLCQEQMDAFKALSVPALALVHGPDQAARPFNMVLHHRIVSLGDKYFEFARDLEGVDHSVPGFTLLAFDSRYMPIDIVAVTSRSASPMTLLGRATLLGQEQVDLPRLSRGLRVHRTIAGYLQHGRRGVVILNEARAPLRLHGINLIPEDEEHRRELQQTLTIQANILEPGDN